MSIENFDISKLKKTLVKVTSIEGKVSIEDRDGGLVETVDEKTNPFYQYGFIPDFDKDLKLGFVKVMNVDLFWGSCDIASNDSIMSQMKPSLVFNLVHHVIEDYFPEKYDYMNFTMADDLYQDIEGIIRQVDEKIRGFFACKQTVAVFIHCEAGLSRSAVIVMAMLMIHNNLSYAQAYDYMAKTRKPQMNCNFIKRIKHFKRNIQ